MTELIFLPYLQQWDGTHLSLNLLAAPQSAPSTRWWRARQPSPTRTSRSRSV